MNGQVCEARPRCQVKRPVICIAAVAALLVLITVYGALLVASKGVNHISVEGMEDDGTVLCLRYALPAGGYTVRAVSAADGELCGDGVRPYDGSMGAYRFLITFGDTDLSDALTDAFPVGEAVPMEGASVHVWIKRVHPNDHGFALYVGSDTPLHMEEGGGGLHPVGGTIRLPIR